MEKNRSWLGSGFLLLAALIWGLAFIFQRSSMEHIGPMTFSAFRYGVSALVLLPFALRKRQRGLPIKEDPTIRRGILCGLFLFAGANLQQAGLVYTTAGKAGFITALYILIVPLLGGIFLKKKVSLQTWICVFIALVGFYLLSIKEGITIELGDLLVFLGAFLWAGHILVVDNSVGNMEPFLLSFVQMAVTTVLSTVGMLLFEQVTLLGLERALVAILYTGVLSGSVAYTLQMYGQRHTEPTLASLIMSLESVFAALAGYLFLQELLTLKETIGAIIILIAVILAQIPFSKQRKENI